MWAYMVGHRQLLLRSNKSEGQSHRCEVLFKNVARLDLPTLIEDLEVEVESSATLDASARQLGAHETGNRTVYVIKGKNCLGYVVADSMTYTADEGEYDSPSSLLQLPGDSNPF
jgi:hypothetical protein